IGLVNRCFTVAPISNQLNYTCTAYCCFEARGLSDEPVGQEAAIAVAADGQLVWVGNAILHQGFHAFENVFAWARENVGNDAQRERVSVARRSTIVRLKYQPSLGGGERLPLPRCNRKDVSIRDIGSPVNQREHR